MSKIKETSRRVIVPKSHRNIELDRLRAFAVLMTISIHFSRIFFPWDIHQDYQNGGSILNLLENSWMGVDLFFVISGFIISKVITDKIDAKHEDLFGRAKFIKHFFIKRFFRIYPLAVAFFVFVLLCSIFFNKSGGFSTPENTIEAEVSIFTCTVNYYFGLGHVSCIYLASLLELVC
jgi:peptidoglycan/LPS O-acetylase OafA/YrhL